MTFFGTQAERENVRRDRLLRKLLIDNGRRGVGGKVRSSSLTGPLPATLTRLLDPPQEATISGGVLTITAKAGRIAHYIVRGEGAAEDILNTITSTVDASDCVVLIRPGAEEIFVGLAGNIIATPDGGAAIMRPNVPNGILLWFNSDTSEWVAPGAERIAIADVLQPVGLGVAATALLPAVGTAIVGLVKVPNPVPLDQVAFNVTTAGSGGSSTATARLAIWNAEGPLYMQKLVDATNAVNTNSGRRELLPGGRLPRGAYYVGLGLSANTLTTRPTVRTFGVVDSGFNNPTGAAVLMGTMVWTGGAAPATFDPWADITPAADSCPVVWAGYGGP